MRFLRSSKVLQPPLPDISIHLTSPSEKIFRPDDAVTGYVSFAPTVPIAPHAIEVSLFGQSLVWYRIITRNTPDTVSCTHFRDNAPMFEVTTNILPAFEAMPPTLQPGEIFTYPFQFQFPAGTGHTRFVQYKKDEESEWTVRPHLLPPSFLCTGKRGAGDHANFAKIEYGIRLRLVCSGVGIAIKKNLHDLVITAPVLFVPLDPIPDAFAVRLSNIKHRKTFTLQTPALMEQTNPAIGFHQNMRDRFSFGTPKLEFEVAVDMPDLMIAGSDFRFRISFDVLSKSDNVAFIPPIHFAVLELELQDLTAIRAQKDRLATETLSG
jgi:hypothetical protein